MIFSSSTASIRPLLAVCLLSVATPAVAQGPPVAAVRYTEARTHELRAEVRLPGTVESLLSAVVAGEVSGKVAAVEVHDGSHVRQGQVLVRLRPEWYELQHDEAVAVSPTRLLVRRRSMPGRPRLGDCQSWQP